MDIADFCDVCTHYDVKIDIVSVLPVRCSLELHFPFILYSVVLYFSSLNNLLAESRWCYYGHGRVALVIVRTWPSLVGGNTDMAELRWW